MDTKNKINDTRKEAFYTELHVLLCAGIDFASAFSLLIESEQDHLMKNLLKTLYHKIIGGASLYQAMQDSGKFYPLDYGVIRIGEQTGRLAESLDFLKDYYAKRKAQRRMVSSAISYPIVILCTAIVVVTFMLTVIVPMFEQVYSRMGGELPSITQSIISFSRVFPRYLLFFILGIATLGIYLYHNRNQESVQKRLTAILLRLPIVKNIIRCHYQAHFCKLLYLLISSGIPLLDSIQMLGEVIVFYPYRKSFENLCIGLEHGQSFSKGIGMYPLLYDQKLIALIRVGEETNRLHDMLRQQGDTLTKDLEHKIHRMGNMLEPILILLVGTLVAIILISMYLPMFRLGSIMG